MYDVIIIGGGPAGYTAAEKAGKNGLKTVLFDRNPLGGVCLNEGCIPSKTLLYSAKVLHTAKDSAKYGINCTVNGFDTVQINKRKTKIIRKLNAGIRARMTEAGVETVTGEAHVTGYSQEEITIQCDGKKYKGTHLLICTGSENAVPPVPGLDKTDFLTSREALDLTEIPESLLIIGGGVIGVELGSYFQEMGSKVYVVEMMDEILGGMDRELSAMLRNELSGKGMEFYLKAKVSSVENKKCIIEQDGKTISLDSSKLLLAAGRKPSFSTSGLEQFNPELYGKGIKVNEYMQTSLPNVYACGDVTGFSMLAHTASREGEVAINHILGKEEKMSYRAIPAIVYTNPEFSGVGATEEQLKSGNIPYKIKKLPMSYAGRFVVENERANGLCKILFSEEDILLGVHILGNVSSEFITIASIAIENGMKLKDLEKIIFPHPTICEILKETINSI